jgi:hypothetical protein
LREIKSKLDTILALLLSQGNTVIENSGSGDGSKDIVFMLGEDLQLGPQTNSEIYIPYTGTVTKVTSSIGEDSFNDSNLIFRLERLSNGTWYSIETLEMQVHEKIIEASTSFPIDNEKLRVVLVSGDYINVSTMNVIVHLEPSE